MYYYMDIRDTASGVDGEHIDCSWSLVLGNLTHDVELI